MKRIVISVSLDMTEEQYKEYMSDFGASSGFDAETAIKVIGWLYDHSTWQEGGYTGKPFVDCVDAGNID